jgi:hypothetical protein
MNRLYLTILLLTFSQIFAQSISEINKNLNISDTTRNEKEIRIYKWFNTTNGSELFRMYKNNNQIWVVELYQHYNPVKKEDKPRFVKSELKSATDLNLVWLYILASDVEFLPNIDQVNYKFKSEAEFVLDRGEYEIFNKSKRPLDGTGYQVIFKDGKKSNNFRFGNYDTYLKNYPNVDELNSYSKLMNIIKTEFNIWNE